MTAIAAREYRQSKHDYPECTRRAALERAALGERVSDIARAMEIPPDTIYYWVHQARREYRIAIGRRLLAGRGTLMAAAERVQQLLDATDLPPAEKRTLQNAITELVAEAMRRE